MAALCFASSNAPFATLTRAQTAASLPHVNFARLTNTSECINAGTNIGFEFYAAAPDLGAFEVGPTNAPDATIAKAGTNFIFTTSGWANRTNYLFTTTNLTLAAAQWPCIGTNKSDLAGNAAFTNGIIAGTAPRFFRTGMP